MHHKQKIQLTKTLKFIDLKFWAGSPFQQALKGQFFHACITFTPDCILVFVSHASHKYEIINMQNQLKVLIQINKVTLICLNIF